LIFFPPNLANLYHFFNENHVYNAIIGETYTRLFFFGEILPKGKALYGTLHIFTHLFINLSHLNQ
jgi:hypothetical protein